MPKAGRPSLKQFSTAALKAEVAKRAQQIEKRHQDLLREIVAVEADIRAAGLAVKNEASRTKFFSARRGRRGGNDRPLHEALADVMRGKTMSPSEAAEAVLRTGYKSAAKNFRLVVNNRLFTLPQFKKVGHGKYVLVSKPPK